MTGRIVFERNAFQGFLDESRRQGLMTIGSPRQQIPTAVTLKPRFSKPSRKTGMKAARGTAPRKSDDPTR
jgi:hypothetical protein